MNLRDKYILKNITVIDGRDNIPQKDMFLKVNGKWIEEVGPMADFKPCGYQEVDMAGHYVIPGLIEAHIHMVGGRGMGDYADTEILCEPEPVRYMRSVYEAQKLLKYGFTTVRDISWNGLYLKRIFGDDLMPGPKVIACGPGLARTGGHCESPQFPWEYVKDHHFWAIISDGVDECRRNVRRVLREGADQIKFWATGGGNWGTDRITDTHYTFEEMKAICDEAHMIKGTLVCAHCETEETIRMAIEAGVDTIEHGEDLTEELAEMMVEKDIILVPTLYLLANWYDLVPVVGIDVPKLDRPNPFLYRDLLRGFTQEDKDAYHDQVKKSFKLAMEKGVKIAVGSDSVYEPSCVYGEESLMEIAEFVKHGMPLAKALQSATQIGAQACGLGEYLGVIEAGKVADMIILEKDPTSSIDVICDHKNFKYIFTDGRLTVEDGRFTW